MEIRKKKKTRAVKNLYNALLSLSLFLLCVPLSAAQKGQIAEQQTFSFKFQNATIKEVMSYIEENSEYVFLYTDSQLTNHKVSLNVDNARITQIMDKLLINSDYGYEIDGKQVVVKEKGETNTPQQKGKKTITGTVVDKDNLPLPGVNVWLKNSTIGVTTDVDG